jgi:hypothetical protein
MSRMQSLTIKFYDYCLYCKFYFILLLIKLLPEKIYLSIHMCTYFTNKVYDNSLVEMPIDAGPGDDVLNVFYSIGAAVGMWRSCYVTHCELKPVSEMLF